MDVKELFHALADRMPWLHVGRLILLDAGIQTSRGWDRSIPSEVSEEDKDKLIAHLQQHQVAGEKALQFFRLSRQQKQAIEEVASSRRAPASAFKEAYPLPVSNSEMAKLEPDDPSMVTRLSTNQGIALIFASLRTFTERIKVPSSDLKESRRGEYEEVIGIRRRKVRAFDALWIPRQGNYVCSAVDFPFDAPQDFPESGQAYMRKQISTMLGSVVEPTNFWKAVDGLYRSRDGRVVELGFATDNAGVKHLKSRSGGRCIRQDLYHRGGSAAVHDEITPFRISVQWDLAGVRDNPARLELALHGVSRMLYEPKSHIGTAVLRGGFSSSHIAFVLEKLNSAIDGE